MRAFGQSEKAQRISMNLIGSHLEISYFMRLPSSVGGEGERIDK
tara:strand:+ start:84 stop:215 length:132 start_codon:yes stop_codon:yes gene_type:complete